MSFKLLINIAVLPRLKERNKASFVLSPIIHPNGKINGLESY